MKGEKYLKNIFKFNKTLPVLLRYFFADQIIRWNLKFYNLYSVNSEKKISFGKCFFFKLQINIFNMKNNKLQKSYLKVIHMQ